jgi:hypothetical protein
MYVYMTWERLEVGKNKQKIDGNKNDPISIHSYRVLDLFMYTTNIAASPAPKINFSQRSHFLIFSRCCFFMVSDNLRNFESRSGPLSERRQFTAQE